MTARARHDSRSGAPSALAAVAVLAATFGAIFAAWLGALDGLSNEAHDALIAARNRDRPAPTSVVLFAVDPQTLNAQQPDALPLNRETYARAIDRLSELGPSAIVVDVQFTERSGNPDADLALLDAVDATDVPVVLGTSQVRDDGDTTVLGGKINLEPSGAVAAHSSLPHDKDRFIRRLNRSADGLPTIAQATANAVGKPGLPHDGTLLDPTVPGDQLRTLPLQRLLDRAPIDARMVRGRVAIIGVTVVGPTGDDLQLIAGSADRVFGVQVQAQAIDTALRGEPLKQAPVAVAYLLGLLMGLVAVLGGRRKVWVQLATAVVALVALVAVAVIAVHADWLLDPVPALVALIVASLGAMAIRAESERRRRAAARATLGRFVPPGVVDDLLDSDRDGLIAPRAQEATVVFCDLRGYTSLVASLEHPEALISILDAYLSAVTETVHRHGGTVVSFQGDGVMSAFGTPVPTDQAPAQAVAAARELQTEALPRVRRELASIVKGAEDLKLGIGVATGHVFAGTVGPPERREYAVVGPTTNLAARLQALTKTEGVDVVLDDATASRAGAPTNARAHTGIVTVDDIGLRSLGPREVRGLSAPVPVWTLADAIATQEPD